jgi:hypothetical protein
VAHRSEERVHSSTGDLAVALLLIARRARVLLARPERVARKSGVTNCYADPLALVGTGSGLRIVGWRHVLR